MGRRVWQFSIYAVYNFNYAIDYDNNNKIELKKSLEDALASAANYINKIGWKKISHVFTRVKIN